MLSAHLAAGTIAVSVEGPPVSPYFLESQPFGQVVMVSWSQTVGLTDTTIRAVLSRSDGSVTAYLTTSIGAGTTPADVVAFNRVVPNAQLPDQLPLVYTDLLTGLNLGPGSYFLVLGGDSGGWFSGGTPPSAGMPPFTIATAPGFTYNSNGAVCDGCGGSGTINAAFIPASVGWRTVLDDPFFQVEGDPVPTPEARTSIALAVAGAIWLGMQLQTRKRAAAGK